MSDKPELDICRYCYRTREQHHADGNCPFPRAKGFNADRTFALHKRRTDHARLQRECGELREKLKELGKEHVWGAMKCSELVLELMRKVEAAEQRVKVLVGIMRKVEWGIDGKRCPYCGTSVESSFPHECELSYAIADLSPTATEAAPPSAANPPDGERGET